MEFTKIEGSDGEKQLGSNGWLHMSLLPGNTATTQITKMRTRNAFKLKPGSPREQWLYCLIDDVYVYLYERNDKAYLCITERDFYPKDYEGREVDPDMKYDGLLSALKNVKIYLVIKDRNIHIVVTCTELDLGE